MKDGLFSKTRVRMLALFFLLALKATAQMTGSLSYRRYTTQDGLPQMMTETIFQDTRGYIYVGTLSGFVRFDGIEFTTFLNGHRWNIVQFMETSEGVKPLSFRQQWLIDDDELSIIPLDAQGRWLLNNFNATDMPNGYVLFEDEQEQHRWVGKATEGHSFTRIFDNEVLDRMTPDRKLYLDGSTLYIPTPDGLFRMSGNDKSPLPLLGGDRGEPEGGVFSLCRSDNTLLAFAEDGIYSVEGDSVRIQMPFNEWSTGYGLIVRPTKDGTLLIADEHSLYSYDGTCVTKLVGGFNLIDRKSTRLNSSH